MSGETRRARYAGFDLATTGLGLGVRSPEGEEAYVHLDIRGAATWHGQPAFELSHVPAMISDLLDQLGAQGWVFEETWLSFAVRQHDMVLLGNDGKVLIEALSWQCDAATRQVEQLRRDGAEAVVGPIAERFILPKLMYALSVDADLREKTFQVMTTGDWIALMLTGRASLSTSDALSNGLLTQSDKQLAEEVISRAGLHPGWFPEVVQSGEEVGRVTSGSVAGDDPQWPIVRAKLAGAHVVASLGDNHATGVGCGQIEGDDSTVVVSAGTSGTVNRVAPEGAALRGNAACFEFYRERLLLLMLGDCCAWYNRFVERFAPSTRDDLDALNEEAAAANPANVRRVVHFPNREEKQRREQYPPEWTAMTLGEQVASTQYSICLELLLHARTMLGEILSLGVSATAATHVEPSVAPVKQFVLTGGLSQSPYFQQIFHTGIGMIAPDASGMLSAREGPLRFQTAAYGALINSMRPDPEAPPSEQLCPLIAIPAPSDPAKRAMQRLLSAGGL